MAKRDSERLRRRAAAGSEDALARVERDVIARGGARYRVIVLGREPGGVPPTPDAVPVICREGGPAWSVPVVTAGTIWSVLREHGHHGVFFHDSVDHDSLDLGEARPFGISVHAVIRLDVPAVRGRWTPEADVLCLACAEPERRPTRVRLRPIVELAECDSVTRCDACGARVVVDWKVGNEHEMVLDLRDALGGGPGFADPPAVMEQTGGMCSALSVRFSRDPHVSLSLVVDEERPCDDVVFLPWLVDEARGVTSSLVRPLPGGFRTVREVADFAILLADPLERKRWWDRGEEQ